MIIIEVKDTRTEPKSGVGKKSGRAYSFKEQSAWAHIPGKPYPVECRLTLNDQDPPHAPGRYALAAESFYVDGFGSLAVKPRLVKAA